MKLVALAFLGPIYWTHDFVQSTLFCFDELYFCGIALQPISWTFFSFGWMGYLNRKV
jgi:hypothetical protein